MDLHESLNKFKKLQEEKDQKAPLSDAAMKKLIPLFVDSTKKPDHKCGNCSMRIGAGETGKCTVVEGTVILAKGVCTFWAEGMASSEKDIHDAQMSKSLAGYVEVPLGMKIQCGTCRFFDKGYCKLWMGSVKPEQCCIAYDSKHAKPVTDA